jgi:hypothetical protein
MSTKKLTLIFEANTREAIASVKSLSGEVNKLNGLSLTKFNSELESSLQKIRNSPQQGLIGRQPRNNPERFEQTEVERQNREAQRNEARLQREMALQARREEQQRKAEEREKARRAKQAEAELQDEFKRQRSIMSARKAGLAVVEGSRTASQLGGVGYGRSKLRTTEQLTAQKTKEIYSSLDPIVKALPFNIGNAVKGTDALTSAFGASRLAVIGLGAAITVGVVGAIALARFGMEEFSRQLEAASKDQLAMLGISSETQRLYGVDQKTADNFYETLQTRTEIAGRDTSVNASDITELNQAGITSYITAFKNSGRSLDDLSKQLVETNTRFAILAQSTPGVTQFQVKSAYTSAITGGLDKALNTQEFFRNSGFAEVIRQTAREEGINLSKASQIQQIDILQKALEKRVPQSLIDRAQNDSVSAQVSSFQDKLFAQRTGIFGIQRDLDLGIEGNQSLFTEIGRTVKLVLGKDGFFDQLAGIFGGINFDLLKILRDGLRALNDFLQLLNNLLSGIRQLKNTIASIPIFPGVNLGDALNTVKKIDPSAPTNALRGGLFDIVGGAFNGVKNFFGFGGASFTGNLPEKPITGLMPLSSAVSAENYYKPPSSKLLIANDSEYIFKDLSSLKSYAKNNLFLSSEQISSNSNDYQKNLLLREINSINLDVVAQDSGPVVSPVTGSKQILIQPGAIVVNSIPSQNPESIAREVISRIDELISFNSQKYF